ncbi:hypothetical protein G5I_00072 [Acromyrmex echinatior]|uniref:Uncharacterized protein n=1 Tax=Acromyrmex echinatior TaxID=103372 RepID=F4W3X1_ACREC|nr:hypothetical protein G5I_00072 [Acromyrmex echinatior]
MIWLQGVERGREREEERRRRGVGLAVCIEPKPQNCPSHMRFTNNLVTNKGRIANIPEQGIAKIERKGEKRLENGGRDDEKEGEKRGHWGRSDGSTKRVHRLTYTQAKVGVKRTRRRGRRRRRRWLVKLDGGTHTPGKSKGEQARRWKRVRAEEGERCKG